MLEGGVAEQRLGQRGGGGGERPGVLRGEAELGGGIGDRAAAPRVGLDGAEAARPVGVGALERAASGSATLVVACGEPGPRRATERGPKRAQAFHLRAREIPHRSRPRLEQLVGLGGAQAQPARGRPAPRARASRPRR